MADSEENCKRDLGSLRVKSSVGLLRTYSNSKRSWVSESNVLTSGFPILAGRV